MPQLSTTRRVRHGASEMFDLVADVERYPEFLPLWIAARVVRREPNVYFTDQIVGLGPVRLRFLSETVLARPSRIDVSANGAPFRHFHLLWSFDSLPNVACRVAVAAMAALESRMLQHVVDRVLPLAIDNIAACFEMRARAPARDNPTIRTRGGKLIGINALAGITRDRPVVTGEQLNEGKRQ